MTKEALRRLLTRMAQFLGQQDVFADASAQIMLQVDSSWKRWSAFLYNNCAHCEHSPDSCPFFNPSEEQLLSPESTSPSDLRQANIHMLEKGQYLACPQMKERENIGA